MSVAKKSKKEMAGLFRDKEILYHCAMYIASCIQSGEYEVTLKGEKVDCLERIMQIRAQLGLK